MKHLRAFLGVAGLLLFGCLAYSQVDPNLEVGLKPYGSFHGGDLDSISMVNGNLNVHIPLWSFPQRGGARLNYFLRYNDKFWTVKNTCVAGTCNASWFIPTSGLGIQIALDQGVTTTAQQVNIGTQSHPKYISVVSFATPDGSSHQAGLVGGASGYYVSIDASGDSTKSGSPTDRTGISYPSVNQNLQSTTLPLPTDSNGNEITSPSTNGSNITDTLGRTIPPFPGPGSGGGDTSKCQGPLPNYSAQPWVIPGYGGSVTVTICFATVHFQRPDYNGDGGTFSDDRHLIQSVVLPDGTAWIFQYVPNEGNLSSITFPTGGSISYVWSTASGLCSPNYNNWVTSRTVNANDGAGGHTWNYTWGHSTPYANIVTDPLGNDTVHTITGLSGSCSFYETEADYYQGSQTTGTLLKTVKTDYSSSSNPFDQINGIPGVTTRTNVVPIRVTTIWADGKQSKVETDYDSSSFTYATSQYDTNSYTGIYGTVVAKREYDYGQGAPGSLLRQTLTTYAWQSGSPNYLNYLAANFLDLPISRVVNNGAGYKCAETDYAYDDSSRLSTPSPPITTQHVAATGVRGNVSSITKKLSTTPCQSGGTWTSITSYTNVYDTGMAYQTIDPLANTTTYTYDSAYAGGYRTQTQFPDTNTPNLAHHSVSGAYDFSSGLLTTFTDQNSNQSTFQYDNMLRFTKAVFPSQSVNGTPMNGETDFYYPDSVTVERQEKIDGSRWTDLFVRFDGLGREIRRIKANDESTPWDQTDTCYDARGLESFVTYPYQGGGLSDPMCTKPGDTHTYDALRRTLSITHPDSTSVSSTYAGAATSVSDEGNGTRSVRRISQVDGLGRLASVCEVTSTTLAYGITGSTTPAACGQDISATGFLTTYQYDGLDDLTSVTQGPLAARSFSYDSLGRLMSASNPESGTVTYSYDNDGNLIQRTQPAPNQTGSLTVSVTMHYDPLNRVYSETYSDTTPPATINYDESSALGVSLTNTIGKRSSEFTGPSSAKISGAVFSYDTMGRVLLNSQCTPQNCGSGVFPVNYGYDLLGNILSSTNGVGTTLTYSYNRAERPTGLTSNLADNNHPATLLSAAHYDAYGLNLSATLGDNLNGHVAVSETRTEVTSGIGAYRGWLGSYSVGTSGGVYSLTMSSYAPNGNILTANDSVNGNWTYGYDDFNRLTSAAKTGASYTYAYDRFGNRWQQNGPTTVLETFDANNHNLPADGVTFDAAGNVKSYYNGSHTYQYTYDAENRLSTVDTSAGAYTYDAEGKRVRSSVSGVISDYIYDLGDHVMTVVGSSGNWTRGEVFLGSRHVATYGGGSSGATYFAFTDALGTERARTTVAATVCETVTNLPFGDGQATSGTCDPTPLHFTGKQRDTESNLDYFGARYYASALGRFYIPDWATAPTAVPYAHYGNPQSLNLYAYVQNNPTTVGDPDGHENREPARMFPSSCPQPEECPHEGNAMESDAPTVYEGATTETMEKAQAQNNSAQQPALVPLANDVHYTVANNGPNAPEVHPVFSPETAEHLNAAFKELNKDGITPQINSAFRTNSDQAYMQSGGSGTNPAAKVSWHQAGAAVDINGTRSPQFKTIISVMKKNGFVWGGDFKSHKDPPHFDGRQFMGNLNQAVRKAQSYWDSTQ